MTTILAISCVFFTQSTDDHLVRNGNGRRRRVQVDAIYLKNNESIEKYDFKYNINLHIYN